MTLGVAGCAILISSPAQYLGRQQDDLLYLIGAQSLLEGRFRLLTVPGAPPLYMIGPGFPALLTPLALLAGENWGVYQAFSALLLSIAPCLIWLWLKRRLGSVESLLICLLFALSPLVLCQAGTVMSEGPYLLATLGLLFALETKSRGAASGLLLFATQARTAAVSLLPGALAGSIAKRRWKEALLLCAPALAGMLAWSLWSRATSGSAQQKFEELSAAYASGVGRLPLVVWDNAVYYLGSWGQSFLPASWAPAAPLAGLALTVGSLKGARRLWRKNKWEPALWILAGTALLHLVWPWQYERYLIMPLPFLLWCLAEGLGRPARPALAALLCAQIVFQSRPWLFHEQSWTKPELSRTYGWIREHTAPSDLLSSVMYVRDGFLTARPALPLAASPDADSLYHLLKSHKVRYVLWQDGLDLGLSLDATSTVRGQLDRDGESLRDAALFKVVYENSEEHARLYELL